MTAKRPNSSDKIVHAVGEDARIPASTPESTPGMCETATRDATTCAITNTERERLKRRGEESLPRKSHPGPEIAVDTSTFPSPSGSFSRRRSHETGFPPPRGPHCYCYWGAETVRVRVRVRDGWGFFYSFSLSFVTFVSFLVLAILPYPTSWLSVSLFSGWFPKVTVSVSSGQVNLPYCSL